MIGATLGEKSIRQSSLDKSKSFGAFTETEENQYAITEAKEFASGKGGDKFLYIYGEPGSGKSHLLNSIGLETISNNVDALVLKTTFEDMLQELLSTIAISNGKIDEALEELKRKYRSADLVLIDDIDRISGKCNNQRELASIIREIYLMNKRIVLAGRIPPEIMTPGEYEREFLDVMRLGQVVGTTTGFTGRCNASRRALVRDICEILEKHKYKYSIEKEVLWRYDIVIPCVKDIELRINCNPRNEYVRFHLRIDMDTEVMKERRVRLLEACNNINRSTEFLTARAFEDCVSIGSEIPPGVGDALEQLVMAIVNQYDIDLIIDLVDKAVNTDEDLYEYTNRRREETTRATPSEYAEMRKKHSILQYD